MLFGPSTGRGQILASPCSVGPRRRWDTEPNPLTSLLESPQIAGTTWDSAMQVIRHLPFTLAGSPALWMLMEPLRFSRPVAPQAHVIRDRECVGVQGIWGFVDDRSWGRSVTGR